MNETAVKTVSRFEADLLHILHFILRRDPAGHGRGLIFDSQPAPRCLSKNAVELIQDTLAKGCISILTTTSGWRTERHVKNGQVCEGNLWQRHSVEALRLSFSRYTLRTLLWLTAQNPARKQSRWPALHNQKLTVGDSLFLYFVFASLQDTDAREQIRSKRLFSRNGLCRLAFTDRFAESKSKQSPDYSIWTFGIGATVLEALQAELKDRWIAVELGKSRITDWRHSQAVGREQAQALSAFMAACEKAKRWDLARFLFPVLAKLLAEKDGLDAWAGGLQDLGQRLADRAETRKAGLALPRAMRRLHEWEQQARLVGYFDDGYAACQLYKSDWEKWHGDDLHSRALELLRQAERL